MWIQSEKIKKTLQEHQMVHTWDFGENISPHQNSGHFSLIQLFYVDKIYPLEKIVFEKHVISQSSSNYFFLSLKHGLLDGIT